MKKNLLSLYLKEMAEAPLLTREDEARIGKKIKKAKAQARRATAKKKLSLEMEIQQAQHELVVSNLRLVVSIARRYTNRGLDFSDLIQEGNLGLMKAVDRFDDGRGCKFSTYATWWIWQGITRAISNKSKTIRIPVDVSEDVNKLVKSFKALICELERVPTLEEIMEKMEIGEVKFRQLLEVTREPISLETPIGGGGTHLGDLIEDKGVEDPFDRTARNEKIKRIVQVLETLSYQEENILKKRFGIKEESPKTLKEVGDKQKLCRERIRQIENKALRKLRCPAKSSALKKDFYSD